VGVAVVAAWLAGRTRDVPLVTSLLGGIAGGSISYGGQHLMGLGKPWLRFTGLEVTAVGASIARNVRGGQPPLAELTFPVFPLYVRVRPGDPNPVNVRLSLMTLVSAGQFAARHRVAPDLWQSLSSGGLVFPVAADRVGCHVVENGQCIVEVAGQHRFGAVAFAEQGTYCLDHELAHLGQDVRDVVLFALPASDWVLSHSGAFGRWLGRFLVLDVVRPITFLNESLDSNALGCAAAASTNAK
jgi:hypothetical protein